MFLSTEWRTRHRFLSSTFSAPNSSVMFFVALATGVVVNPLSMSAMYWYIESNTNGRDSTHQLSRVSTRQRQRSAPLSVQHPNPASAGTGIHTTMGNPARSGSSLFCVCLQRAPSLLLFVVLLSYSCEPLIRPICAIELAPLMKLTAAHKSRVRTRVRHVQ